MTYVVIGVLVLSAVVMFQSSSKPLTAVDTSLAQCLTDKGVSLGGAEWCGHCSDQKELFGNSFKYIDYHDCEDEVQWCQDSGIKGFPTWVFPDGKLYPGAKSLEELAKLSGCEL